MSVKFSLFSFWVGFLTCFIILLQPCWALDVNAVRFGNHADKERAVIELSGPSKFRSFVLTKPDRVIVDLPEFAWKVKNIQPTPGSAIKDVRYGVLGGGQGRLVFETSRPVMIKSAFAMGKGSGQPDRIVIDFSATSAATMAATTGQVLGTLDGKQGAGASGSTKTAKPAATQSIEDAKSKKKKLIIIDPGHGGQDPGARGANGMYEKSIVLAVGLELRRQLEDAGYRVAMTRSTDVFIPLRERVKFARKKEG